MYRRRALLAATAAVLSGCTWPRPEATPVPTRAPSPPPTAESTATPLPQPTSTSTATSTLVPTARPTALPTATATPTQTVQLDIRLWNGTAEVQLDGQSIQPGTVDVERGPHQIAALVDDEPVSIVDAPSDGGGVDLFVPPPLAGLAVMVENQADARPQSGLPQADVVYECLAEGGITRFIALFLTGDADVVGPVRSLRHYFAFLAADYGADLIHIGASPEGFAWRDAMNLGALDESAGDPGVWRVSSRRPPHNAYTSTGADRGFLTDRGRQRNRLWGPLRFSPSAPQGSDAATQLSIGFLPWPYRVTYTWEPATGTYLRSMEGTPHRDAETGERIAPASVVVQLADVEAIPDDPKLRLDVDLVSASGQLVVFSDGTRRVGTWSKAAPRTSTVWLDSDGAPIVLPPGQVWVEIVPIGSRVESS